MPVLRVKWEKKFGNILLASGRSEEREAHSIVVATSADDQLKELAESSKEGLLTDTVLDIPVCGIEDVQLRSVAPS